MDMVRWLPLGVWGVIGGGFLASFASLVAWRVPRGQSILRPSFCPTCDHGLGPCDLVPVVSWVWLRGRCRYCETPIPLRELVVEALGM
ncbi:MAG: prepilin peptidase, partial [Clostridia bacterium]